MNKNHHYVVETILPAQRKPHVKSPSAQKGNWGICHKAWNRGPDLVCAAEGQKSLLRENIQANVSVVTRC